MSREKLRIHQTDEDNLASNLRGEVGDIVGTWVLRRLLRAQIAVNSSGDIEKDVDDGHLGFLGMIAEKLQDSIIGQLSELAQEKIGRLNFHFAAIKLKALASEAAEFRSYVVRNKFVEKRNYSISHKELPETWTEHRHIHIPEPKVTRAVAMALHLIKKIDRHRLGPSARFLWYEMRKRRYNFAMPGRIGYMLLPYMTPSPEARQKIIKEEENEGLEVWTEMETMVNERPATVRVAKKWGAIDMTSIRFLDEEPKDDESA